MNQALIIIAKQPAGGQTKTRLCPPFSPQAAARLYESFLQDMLDLVRSVPGVTPIINYWPLSAKEYFRQLAPDFEMLPQQGCSLGQRLDNALSHCLTGGFRRAVITNSDSPTLPADYLAQAFAKLNQADVVLGPCDDGGYYLIGLTRPQPRLLREVKMSTPTVAADTLALAKEEGLRTALLPEWYDIDTIDTFNRLVLELQQHPNIARHTRKRLQDFNA